MKYVYAFAEGNRTMREVLGGKGANLAEMTGLGLPVPRGFTITTDACKKYYKDGKKLSDEIYDQIYEALEDLEKLTRKKFGDSRNPLLVSVRSGAPVSMPGMMDTVLNLGLNDDVVEGLANATGNPRFAYDSYRRFIQMFSDVVMGLPGDEFEGYLERYKKEHGIKNDVDLSTEDLVAITNHYKDAYRSITGKKFPQKPKEQLIAAALAVFGSWNNERAVVYRRLNDIPANYGTAVNVQEMVYGNRGNNSGTGVAFTRNPATGERKLYGEYLINAQGEDVVAGIRTPEPIDRLKKEMPHIYAEFERICTILEHHFRDMQDMEFTIEEGRLFMLQTRNGKRTAAAAIKVAVDLVQEGMITQRDAILMVEPKQLDQILHPVFDTESEAEATVIGEGLAASPGAATGQIYFSAADVLKAHNDGIDNILLVRMETSPEDIEGMNTADGILTSRGGMTSHAAVVARGMGKCCISGAGELEIDLQAKTLTAPNGTVFNEGDFLSLNGTTGKVYAGQIKTEPPAISGDFDKFMAWADAARSLRVRANADTPKDAMQAVEFGAEGIGLCRTEHMFFGESRILKVRKMILADTIEEREAALDELLPLQRKDFIDMYRVMNVRPMTIRYLDPPLHEFLPHTKKEIRALARELDRSPEDLEKRIEELSEVNPMMGHRGVRLAVTYPEIAVMQTKAVISAAIEVNKAGIGVTPEIMIPLTTDLKELNYVKEVVCKTADKMIKESRTSMKYEVGTMIETPRAVFLAWELAQDAEFFSFGTNDLTQLTFGFSRDDAGKFIGDYIKKGIFDTDPFARIDEHGVGELIKVAVNKSKSIRPEISVGICGEHGGDPGSVEFCHRAGLNYVSCSPFRVPIARLAAAQAAVKEDATKKIVEVVEVNE
ncbi:MAG: pyruvate, phosphate dikinase [Bifidobacteriaceae bacterium]|jgi:pyruvate,orthophosphate dikinase|nr:pyruvate, phosphate dikinase [Bifidobacteriaceae bacterium]